MEHLLKRHILSPSVTLPSLVTFHQSLTGYQSTGSYNLLLHLAIRHAAFGTAHRLLEDMQGAGILENVETWQLRVRLLVREGKWPDAWTLVMNAERNWDTAQFVADGIPVTVWTELLGTTKRGVARRRHRLHGFRLEVVTGLDRGMDSLARYDSLMQQKIRLAMPTDNSQIPPAKVITACVAALLRMKQTRMALSMTLHLIPIVPRDLALRLVHLHFGLRLHTGLQSYHCALRMYHGFLAVCPTLRPDATTLFLILGHLERAYKPATIAYKFAFYFRSHWGDSVLSPRVWRRLLSLAVKDGRRDLMRAALSIRRTMTYAAGAWDVQQEVLGGQWRNLKRLEKKMEAKKAGTERQKWDRLAKRAEKKLRRLRSKS